MKRTICLLLALMLCLAALPAVRADVIVEPQDSFYNKHWEECRYIGRRYLADGPNGSVTVYQSPETNVKVRTVENGTVLGISFLYTDADGIGWGFCEYFDVDADGELRDHWIGWIPMDHLLLKYDSQCFREEFADRIEAGSGEIGSAGSARVHFWGYPGSDTLWAAMVIDDSYQPQYMQTFTDDAGRQWAYINYYAGIRDVWVCLDAPTADYDTLYAEHGPQAVTHPVRTGTTAEIVPKGPDLTTVLLGAGAVALASAAFLWLSRKKK